MRLQMVASQQVEAMADEPAAPAKPEKIYYRFLDGVRGLAGIGVVLGHMYTALMFFSPDVQVPRRLAQALGIFSLGQTRLDVFIVLSGYSLSMPIVRAGGLMKGGLGRYFERRAGRIIPPYYAALVFTLFMIWFARASGLKPQTPIDFDPAAIITHFLLVHNLSHDLFERLNPPLWSIAVEWQLYLFLPFVLLPLTRRVGPLLAAPISLALGLVPHFFFNGFLDWSRPWFVGLFAMGAAGAWISLDPAPLARRLRDRVPWGKLALLVGGASMGYCFAKRGFYHQHKFLVDPFIGLAAMGLLIFCEKHVSEPRLVVRMLSSKLLGFFGSFSYSLFLIHYPVLVVFWFIQIRFEMSAVARVGLMFSVGLLTVLLFSYAFYLLVERPSLRWLNARRRPRQVLAPSPLA
jgi:peptidoglycan/LPS O-acetylase OafA/YrhL